MLLAAGLGTRMKPLTDTRPKPLIEVGGRTLVNRVLDKLVAQGVTRAIVNVHYFPDMLAAPMPLLAPMENTLGFRGPGDFYLAPDGQVERRGDRATAPYVFAGTHITRAELLRSFEAKRFSANIYWNTFASRGRLFGTVMNPFWMHVGDPAGRDEADAKLNLMGPGA